MANTNQIKIAEKLFQSRKAFGLTQTEVAEILHKTQYYVSRCETGKRRLDIFELETFAKLYEKPLSYFLND